MPRQLKPQKLDTYKHSRLGVAVDLFLDRNSHVFFFELAGKRYTNKSMDGLTNDAHAAIEATHGVDWIPIITVERFRPFAQNDDGSFIGFHYTRSWIAKKHDDQWIQHRWAYDDEKELNPTEMLRGASGFHIYRKNFTGVPHFAKDDDWHDARNSFLPYTVELWESLGLLVEKIKLLRKKLDELLMTEDGLKKLAAFASQLSLSDGKPEKVPEIRRRS